MTAVDETAVLPEQDVTEAAEPAAAEERDPARAAWFRNARGLLDFMEARPELPLPPYLEVPVPMSAFLDVETARHAVGAAAELLGVEPRQVGGRFSAGLSIGSACYHAFSMAPAALADSATVRRLGLAAFEEALGGPAPKALVAEMAPVGPVEPQPVAEPEPAVDAEEPKRAKKASVPRPAKKAADKPAPEKQDGGESE